MPLKKCSSDGKSGYKWGDSGHCYTGPGAKKKAIKQGVAESYHGGEAVSSIFDDYEISTAELQEAIDDLPVLERTAAYISKKERDKVADDDFGDPENRKYPIRNQHDLDSAAKLIGRAPKDKQSGIKSRIKKIAKRKGLKLPESWE